MKRQLYILASWLFGCLALLLLWGFITSVSSPKSIAAPPAKQTAWITGQGVATATATGTATATPTLTPTKTRTKTPTQEPTATLTPTESGSWYAS